MSSPTASAHKEGFLWKVGGSVQTWKRRYMVLKNKYLSYYKTDQDQRSSSTETPQGIISLDGASVAALLDNNQYSSPSSSHNRNLFGITPPHSSRMYVIQAPSEAEREAWIGACAAAGAFRITLTPATSRTQFDSLLEGWMDKDRGKLSSMFSSHHSDRYYFCLFHDKLTSWRSSQTSTAPEATLLLDSSAVCVASGGPEEPLVVMSSKKGARGESKWLLRADNAQQKDTWFRAIHETIAGEKFEYPPYAATTASGAPGASLRTSVATDPHFNHQRGHSTASSVYSPSLTTPSSAAAAAAAGGVPSSSKLKHQHAFHHHHHDDDDDESDDDDRPHLRAIPSSRGAATGPAGAPLPMLFGDDSDEEPQEGAGEDEPASSNDHVAEASSSPINHSDEMPPPPPPMEDGEDEGAAHQRVSSSSSLTLFSPSASSSSSSLTYGHAPTSLSLMGVSDPLSGVADASTDSLLLAQPDVLLQLHTLWATRFGSDTAAMARFLDSFVNLKDPMANNRMTMTKGSLQAQQRHGRGGTLMIGSASPASQARSVSSDPSGQMMLAMARSTSTGSTASGSSSGGGGGGSENVVVTMVSSPSSTPSSSSLGAAGGASSPHRAIPAPRLLHVHLLEARSLPSMDSNGLSDPYAVLHLRGSGGGSSKEKLLPTEKVKTRTIHETLDPVWDQQITLDLPHGAEELVVDMFDHDRFSTDDFIGRAVINLQGIVDSSSTSSTSSAPFPSLTGWFPLTSLKEPWAPLGSVFLTAVVDPKFVLQGNRARESASFLHRRNQVLLALEKQYFQERLERGKALARGAMEAPTVATVPPAAGALASRTFSSTTVTAAAGADLAASAMPLDSVGAAAAAAGLGGVVAGGGDLSFHATPSCSFGGDGSERLKVWIGTWNAGNAPPPDDLSPWIPLYAASLYVVGTQECNYAPRRDNKSCKVDWIHCLVRHFGRDYTLLKFHSLWEIRLAVFVANTHLPFVSNVCAGQEATGIGNVLGNKGGVLTSFLYAGSLRLAFVNSHLAAHQGASEVRNQNYRTIVRNINNYRLDYGNQGDAKSPSPELFAEMVSMIQSGRSEQRALLWDSDQLVHEMECERVFLGFEEGSYEFAPTFKVKRNARHEYTAQRSPAWCDRILRRSVPGFPVRQLTLQCASAIATSDHKPLSSIYELLVPPSLCPLDRTLGAAVIRLHDLRCTGLRVFKETHTQDAALLAAGAKELDPFLVVSAPFLCKPYVTPVLKKVTSPQWLELPPAPLAYNALSRLRTALLHIRVCNKQSQDSIVGRAVVSLTGLHAEGFESEAQAAHAALQQASTASAVAESVNPLSPSVPSQSMDLSDVANPASARYAYRGHPHTLHFDVPVTFAGMPAGNISGSVSIMWKAVTGGATKGANEKK